MSKNTKMKFSEDKMIDGVVTYKKGEVYEIAEGSVARWLKRGGVIVGQEDQYIQPPVVTSDPSNEDTDNTDEDFEEEGEDNTEDDDL